jgi:hypothetical protein
MRLYRFTSVDRFNDLSYTDLLARLQMHDINQPLSMHPQSENKVLLLTLGSDFLYTQQSDGAIRFHKAGNASITFGDLNTIPIQQVPEILAPYLGIGTVSGRSIEEIRAAIKGGTDLASVVSSVTTASGDMSERTASSSSSSTAVVRQPKRQQSQPSRSTADDVGLSTSIQLQQQNTTILELLHSHGETLTKLMATIAQHGEQLLALKRPSPSAPPPALND